MLRAFYIILLESQDQDCHFIVKAWFTDLKPSSLKKYYLFIHQRMPLDPKINLPLFSLLRAASPIAR